MKQTNSELNYKELGLKVGIEVHQQLKTKSKLFCNCENKLQKNNPDFRLIRSFRPVLGEEGKFDKAMLLEFKKKNVIEYEGYYDSICTYEYDETPPFECDQESLDIAIELALLLNLNIIDELHICRKNYVDGSVPAGFQRTIIVGVNGNIPLNDKKQIGIEILCLEEDACRKISQDRNKIAYRLDRLGIPLIEIVTAPDINTPEEARNAAYRLGMLLRSTGKVKRVIGATRQDINVSIKGGTRVEIKGVQKLDWIQPLIRNECKRQVALLEIKEKMKNLGITQENLSQKPIDVSKLLKATKCKFLKQGIKNKQKVWGLRVPKMEGIWGIEVQDGRRFGTEVADKVRSITGIKGLIHSDEDLKKYNLKDEEINKIKAKLKCQKGDLFVLIMGGTDRLKDAMDIVEKRTIAALNGVPPETRRALENMNHEFLRDIHGGARLYPDTDSREIILDKKRIKSIRKKLPVYPWELIPKLSKKYKISPSIIENLIMKGDIFLFEKILSFFKGKPILVATTITDLIKTIRRDGYHVENLSDQHLIDLFQTADDGLIAKEAFDKILIYLTQNPLKSVKDSVKKMSITSISKEDLGDLINKIVPQFKELIKERKMGAMGPVMGAVMKEVRGRIDGKLVNQAVKEAILRLSGGNKQ